MTGARPIGLVIFDCDGVLVDSEPISLAVTREVLSERGCRLTEKEGYAHLLGRSLGTIAAWLRDERQVELTEQDLFSMRERLLARFGTELAPIPHVADTVSALPWPVCVASSSQPERIARSLEVTGLLPLFAPHLFSATMVPRGKPAPDLFLHAARKMGVPPEDCVVIEDSPAGIKAARAAGMRVVGFLGGAHAGPAGLREAVANLGPMAMIADMEELPALLRRASAGTG
ncbi:HAD family hydrolase [Allosediminivita pacifica]|uniref:HAD superfamily hydrolase (TIGR01509 family) n=1 Tax=Allosediminivita pacifica TaxID=1267769 RepID=A0A2T6AUJ6_9RHOB|nr:HAD family hydrolase [Allosediminivita pacifica]PTX47478.1 HAD superfamily hydrolase (TIGR01509 family) [Allosediminivita pacifica]GGB14508.1 haloacid dehalogenase [Allosediminivita pacifica]